MGITSGLTILVSIGERREPPNYVTKDSESAPRKFFASYGDCVKYVKEANNMGELRRELLKLKQLIPIQLHVFGRHYVDGAPLYNDQLSVAVQRQAGYLQSSNVTSDQRPDEVRRAAKMKPSWGPMLNRSEVVSLRTRGLLSHV